jgi:hypothetical protein
LFKKFFFYKIGEQEGKTVPVWGWGAGCNQWERGRVWEGKYAVLCMYAHGKMRTVESILGMGEGGLKKLEEVNSSMIYLIYCKDFCNYHDVPQHNNLKKKKRTHQKKN